MQQILMINGHEKYSNSQGQLNRLIFRAMYEQLKKQYSISTTTVDDGYDVEEEREKFLAASIVIYQTPIFWFSLPGKFKTYFDQVLKRGVFYVGGKGYGRGGLLSNKRYMFSTTWNAPIKEFETEDGFFQGKSIEDVLFPIHCMHRFLGMQHLSTFSVHNVVHDPKVEEYIESLEHHLKQVSLVE